MLNAKYSCLKQLTQMLNAQHVSSSTDLSIQIKMLQHFALQVLITLNDEVAQQQTQPKVFSRNLFPEPLLLDRPKLEPLVMKSRVLHSTAGKTHWCSSPDWVTPGNGIW